MSHSPDVVFGNMLFSVLPTGWQVTLQDEWKIANQTASVSVLHSETAFHGRSGPMQTTFAVDVWHTDQFVVRTAASELVSALLAKDGHVCDAGLVRNLWVDSHPTPLQANQGDRDSSAKSLYRQRFTVGVITDDA